MKTAHVLIILLIIVSTPTLSFSEHQNPVSSKMSDASSYPTYNIDRTIDEKIMVVGALGKGSKKETIQFESRHDGRIVSSNSVVATTNWEITADQGNIIVTLYTVTDVISDGVKAFRLDVEEELVTDKTGKKIGYRASLNDGVSKIPSEFISQLEEVQPKWISDEYNLNKVGLKIKTGDKLKEFPFEFEQVKDLIGEQNYLEMRAYEIVKGYGKHKNKEVIVTELFIDKEYEIEGIKTKIIGGGYDLYEKDSFVNVGGEFAITVSSSSPSQDQTMKIWGSETEIEYVINKVITP